jgi:hypothetical protein
VHLESSKSKRLCTLGGGGLLCLRNFSGGGGTTGDSSWGEIADCVNNAATARLCASQKKRDLPRRRTARRDETRDPEGSSGSSAISTPPGRATPPKLSAARKNTPAPRVYFLQYFRYFKLNIAFVRWHFRVRRADQYDSTLLPFSSPSPLSTIGESGWNGVGGGETRVAATAAGGRHLAGGAEPLRESLPLSVGQSATFRTPSSGRRSTHATGFRVGRRCAHRPARENERRHKNNHAMFIALRGSLFLACTL